MNRIEAEQIADLLNTQNQLTENYTAEKVIEHQNDIIYHIGDDGKVICAVEVSRVQWYQAEIKHLTVDPDVKRNGLGRKLLVEAEEKVLELGALVVQCTVRDNNTGSIKLFLSSGYHHCLTVKNPKSGNRVMILQKPI